MVRRCKEELQQIKVSLRHFVDREVVVLLKSYGVLMDLEVTEVKVSSNQIHVMLRRGGEGAALVVTFEEQAGWLMASITSPPWLSELSARERGALRQALVGLYAMSGVDMTKETLRRQLPAGASFNVVDGGRLVVWLAGDYAQEVTYPLGEKEPQRAKWSRNAPTQQSELPALNPEEIFLSRDIVSWKQWVRFWSGEEEELMPGKEMGV